MYDRLLLPVDERTIESAVPHHVGELAHWADASVTLLYVADTTRDSVTVSGTDVIDSLAEQGQEVVAEVGGVLESLGVSYDTDVVQGGPAPTIVEYAESGGYDVVVMPTRGREGLSRYLLGSVTEKVVRLSSVPVLTTRLRADEQVTFPFESVLVATDGSAPATRAATHGVDLAAALDARLHVLSAVDDASSTLGSFADEEAKERREQGAREAIAAVAEQAANAGVEDVETHVVHDSPADAIVDTVEAHDIHAVVLGTTGRQGLDRILLGSVAEKTVRTCPVPVITVAADDN